MIFEKEFRVHLRLFAVPMIMDHMGLQWMGYVDAAIRVAKRLSNVVWETTGMLLRENMLRLIKT